MRRFLTSPPAAGQQVILLDRDQSKHISKVLRLKEGERIELFDGQGMVFQAQITDLGPQVEVRIEAADRCIPPTPRLHLHLGLLKGKKMDLVVQKATELGVHTLSPFVSDFTDVRPAKAEKRERWHKIALEACKQCGRNWPLTIKALSPLPDQVEALPAEATALVFWEHEDQRDLAQVRLPPTEEDIHLFIGPEGGFSDNEVNRYFRTMTTVSLGPLTLRAETAVIAALSLTLFVAGRLKQR